MLENALKSRKGIIKEIIYTNHSRYTKKKYTAAPEMQCFRGFSLHSKATDKAAIGSFVCSSVDLIPVIIAFQRWIIIC